MSWETLADNTLKRAISTFKTSATYKRAAAPTVGLPIDGVYDRPSLKQDAQTGAMIQNTNPTFGIRLADLPAEPDQGDKLTIAAGLYGAGTYLVMESVPDGQGGAMLVLQRDG